MSYAFEVTPRASYTNEAKAEILFYVKAFDKLSTEMLMLSGITAILESSDGSVRHLSLRQEATRLSINKRLRGITS